MDIQSLDCFHILLGVSLNEPHTSELNGGFFIYILSVVHIPYVCLEPHVDNK